MFSFNTFGLSQLNNAEFTASFINIKKEIALTTNAKLGVPTELNAQFNDDLDQLQDQVYYSTSSSVTADMEAADKKRDAIYRRLLLRLQVVNYGDDVRSLVTAREAVNAYILSKYDIYVCDKAYQEETPILAGFIKDCRAKLTEDDIDALGIDNDLSALESANNAFIVAYSERIKEKSVFEAGLTKTLRQKVLNFYRQLVVIAEFYANTTDETLSAKATDCQQFISRCNVIITDAKSRWQQRQTLLAKRQSKAAATDATPDANANPDANATPNVNANPIGGETPQPQVVGPEGARDEQVEA